MLTNLPNNQYHIINVKDEEKYFFRDFASKFSLDSSTLDENVILIGANYTGYINTPFRRIELPTKYNEINLNHVIRLYYYTYGNFVNFNEPLFDINEDSNFESIIPLFLKELMKVVKRGLVTEYITEEVQFKYVVGNVDFVSTYKNILLVKENPIESQVDTITANNPLNRVLLAALKKIENSPKYEQESKFMQSYFYKVTNEYTGHENIIFNTKNNYCQLAYFFANLILTESFLGNMGTSNGESLIINLDVLFEDFIKKVLLKETKDSNFSYWRTKQTYAQSYDKMIEKQYIPDLLYGYNEVNGTADTVFDMKNKAYGVFKNPDIYQLSFYSTLLKVNRMALIYPSFEENNLVELEIFSESIQCKHVYAVFINIASSTKEQFEFSIQSFISNIYTILSK